MHIKKYLNLEEALKSITQEDKNYILIRHTLKPKEKVGFHYHETDEWIIFNNGQCEIVFKKFERIGFTGVAEFEIKTETVGFDLTENQCFFVVFVPKGHAHELLAISDISYWVLRNTNNITD